MPDASTFDTIFRELRLIYRSLEEKLVIVNDEHGDFYANTKLPGPDGRELFFGGIRIGKSYVSFHLMPVYMFPDLLEGISDNLHKRMQGKSCFNFTRYDRALIREIATLTKVAYARMRSEGHA
jgi:hypothetical protein